MKRVVSVAVVALAMLLAFQYRRAIAEEITITITGSGSATKFAGGSSFKANDTLKITCPATTKCAGIKAVQGASSTVELGSGSGDIAITKSPLGGSGDLVITFNGVEDKLTLVVGSNAPAPPAGSAGTNAPTPPAGSDGSTSPPAAVAFANCPNGISSGTVVLERGEVLVDTDGNVLASKLDTFTEQDKLVVWVVGPTTAFAGLKVTRTSTARDVTVLHILGDTSGLFGSDKQAKQLTSTNTCKRFELSDFSSGQGAFTLSNASAKSSNVIDFAVRPVYDGMFTVGFVASHLVQPEFFIRTLGDRSEVARKPSSSFNGRYALQYTAFLPFHHWNPARFGLAWDQIIGVSAGVLLDDPIKNVLLGANIGPVGGFSLNAGVHIGEVQRLADGVKTGDTIAADASLPLDTKWSSNYYVGVTLDIRVATKLFFSLFTK